MRIVVTCGRGIGGTELSAFDAALWDAGVGDYNLLPLSSVIPAGSEIVVERYHSAAAEVGWKLYCVLSIARRSVDCPSEAWAGLGWAYRRDRGGVFIEECGPSRGHVVGKLATGHAGMAARRGAIGNLEMALVAVPDPAPYACAIVTAVYASAAWS